MLTTDEYQELKTSYLRSIVSGTEAAGGLPPHIALFGIEKKDLKRAIVFMKIDEQLMGSEEGKNLFIDKVVPVLSKSVKKEFDVHSVAWASEAWLREAKADAPMPENYKDLPIKKEIVIVSIESIDKTECVMYDVVRDGHKVTSSGDFVESVSLKLVTESPEMISASGRFTGLIKHFVTT